MAASDDFKQQLKTGKIIAALQTALSEAIELKITTWVSSAESDSPVEQPAPGSRMRTRINIVDGDITNEIGDQFLSRGPYNELQQFHFEQVRAGREIIQNNLQSIQKLFGMLGRIQHPTSGTVDVSDVEPLPLPPHDLESGSQNIEPEVPTPGEVFPPAEINVVSEASEPEVLTPEEFPLIDVASEASAETNLANEVSELELSTSEELPSISLSPESSAETNVANHTSEPEVPTLEEMPPAEIAESSAEVQATGDLQTPPVVHEVSLIVEVTPIPSQDSAELTTNNTVEDLIMTAPTTGADGSEWNDDDEWEDIDMEQPKQQPPTPSQLGWGIDWGTEEEWDEVDTGDERETFIGFPVTDGAGWDDNWGEAERDESNSAETNPDTSTPEANKEPPASPSSK